MNERTNAPGPDSEGVVPEPMKSLRSGLRVLLEFERGPRDISMTELAKRCELSKSQVSKILAALVDSGLVVQDPTSRTYAIGKRSYVLGSRYTAYDPLCQSATPVMRQLLNRTGHSVRLSVPHGDQSLYLIGLEGPLFLDTGWNSGSCVPIGASSAGRVLMAFMEPEERARMLDVPVPPLTQHTIRDRAKVAELVEQARLNGFSVQRNETTPGLGVATVPVFRTGQQIVGALGLSFPSHQVSPEEEPELVAALHDAARVISQRLGCGVYPFGAARAYVNGDGRPQASRADAPPVPEGNTYQ
ncbi:MAG TPA: IclR family transcriptional regulator [Ramlibacter sp.]|nr:IclR family transcriptional regulator [Ramlibacter sp.]